MRKMHRLPVRVCSQTAKHPKKMQVPDQTQIKDQPFEIIKFSNLGQEARTAIVLQMTKKVAMLRPFLS